MTSLPYPARLGSWLLAATLLFTGMACTGVATKKALSQGWWKGDGVPGKPKIVIDLTKQQVRYFKGGQLVGVSVISSGREGHHTVTGSYNIIEKDEDHRSSLYGAFCDENRKIVVPDVDDTKDTAPAGTHFIGASMPYFMRIVGGFGMHEGYLPGYPASHGCIRLPGNMAHIFYNETPLGTPVEIVGDASLAERQTGLVEPEAPAVAAATDKSKPKGADAPRHAGLVTTTMNQTAPTKPKATTLPPGTWLRIGRVTENSKPTKLPFGATVYLQQ